MQYFDEGLVGYFWKVSGIIFEALLMVFLSFDNNSLILKIPNIPFHGFFNFWHEPVKENPSRPLDWAP